jgi:Domain of unknown function (DUF4383)
MPSNPTAGGHHHRTMTTTWTTTVQKAAAAVGIVFVVVAVLGFIPGVTTQFDSVSAAGTESRAMLLGVFQVSVLHNVVHLALGVAGLAMAGAARSARTYLVGGGVIYLALWVYGLLIDKNSAANFVPVNTADDWLHLALGAAMVAMGLVLGNRGRQDERIGEGGR